VQEVAACAPLRHPHSRSARAGVSFSGAAAAPLGLCSSAQAADPSPEFPSTASPPLGSGSHLPWRRRSECSPLPCIGGHSARAATQQPRHAAANQSCYCGRRAEPPQPHTRTQRIGLVLRAERMGGGHHPGPLSSTKLLSFPSEMGSWRLDLKVVEMHGSSPSRRVSC